MLHWCDTVFKKSQCEHLPLCLRIYHSNSVQSKLWVSENIKTKNANKTWYWGYEQFFNKHVWVNTHRYYLAVSGSISSMCLLTLRGAEEPALLYNGYMLVCLLVKRWTCYQLWGSFVFSAVTLPLKQITCCSHDAIPNFILAMYWPNWAND